jgi:hypothetical protein
VDSLYGGIAVLGEDLCEFKSQGDAFSHTLDLNGSMLFEDKFGKEKSLVQL